MTHLEHHFKLGLYIAWFAGTLIHIVKRASMSSLNGTPLGSMNKYFAKYWPVIMFRTAIELGVFWLWTDHPQAMDAWLDNAVHGDFDKWLPQIAPVAFIFGLAADSLIDFAINKAPFVPDSFRSVLQKEIPALPDK